MNWSDLFHYREEIHQRFPEIWDIKIVKKRLLILLKHIRNGDKILEIGAYDRTLGEKIKAHYPQVEYRSMDIDRSRYHDYYALEDVEERFDGVLLFEVIEHLELEEGRKLLKEIHAP